MKGQEQLLSLVASITVSEYTEETFSSIFLSGKIQQIWL